MLNIKDLNPGDQVSYQGAEQGHTIYFSATVKVVHINSVAITYTTLKGDTRRTLKADSDGNFASLSSKPPSFIFTRDQVKEVLAAWSMLGVQRELRILNGSDPIEELNNTEDYETWFDKNY